MNAFDLALLSAALLAAMIGSGLGLIRHFAIWLGISLGGVFGIVVQTSAADRAARASEAIQLITPVTAMLLCTGLGAILLSSAARALKNPDSPKMNALLPFDRTLGGAAGVTVVVFLAWSLIPVVTANRYWPIEVSNESSILDAIIFYGPETPSTLQAAAEVYNNGKKDDPAPSLDPSSIAPTHVPSPPATPKLSPSALLAVSAATLRVEGRACSYIQSGTGVVLGENLVVTNAHVVAGESETTSVSNGGMRRKAEVVAFDPRRDIAVLRMNNLEIKPIKISTPTIGATVAVFGYPGGRGLRSTGGLITDERKTTGPDLYGAGHWSRKVLTLRADLEPGDSGGPVVSQSGKFVGLSLAIDSQIAHTSYALDPSEIRSVLKTVGPGTVSTGRCLGK